MKALVTYYSETGNTEKLAHAIYDGIEQAKKEIVPVGDVTDLDAYDVIFYGFPVQSHSVPAKAREFLKKVPEGKQLALFATHGSLRGGQLAVTAFYDALTVAKQATIIGTFGCQGKVKQQIIDALMHKAEHRAWALEAQGAMGHPDPADLEDGKDFAAAMIKKARASV
ncbi:MAG: flavodoxin family protein [Desulfobacteraceae bacterium]